MEAVIFPDLAKYKIPSGNGGSVPGGFTDLRSRGIPAKSPQYTSVSLNPAFSPNTPNFTDSFRREGFEYGLRIKPQS